MFIYYKDKYWYLLGLDSGKDVVKVIKSNFVYGYGKCFVNCVIVVLDFILIILI